MGVEYLSNHFDLTEVCWAARLPLKVFICIKQEKTRPRSILPARRRKKALTFLPFGGGRLFT